MSPYLSYDALRLLRSFLIQPKVKVLQNNKISQEFSCSDRGYSQGSNLSTFLFICLMRLSHNLPPKINSYSFADDDQLVISEDNIEDLENQSTLAIETFHRFCKDHNIKLNVKKTFYCLSGSFKKEEKEKFTLKTFGEEIERINEMNMLGVKLSEDLEFQNNLEAMTGKTTKNLKASQRVRQALLKKKYDLYSAKLMMPLDSV